jgi:hypothetical protein
LRPASCTSPASATAAAAAAALLLPWHTAAAAAVAAAAEQIAVEGDCSDMLVCLQGLHLVQLPPVDLSLLPMAQL